MLNKLKRIDDGTNISTFEKSTQCLIREGIRRKLIIDILDEKENFLGFSNGVKYEYIKQATKTRLDNFISILIMQNKAVGKHFLQKHGYTTPHAEIFSSFDSAIAYYDRIKNEQIVIKPSSQNMGIGITILKSYTLDGYTDAIKKGFAVADTLLVEKFVSGNEYRLLVIGNEVVGVINKIPNFILGNGYSTLRELVRERSKNVEGFLPDELLFTSDSYEYSVIKNQGFDWNSILEKDYRLFLKDNILGQDEITIDYTDSLSGFYKEIAIDIAKKIGASICGIDMLIPNITEDSQYWILELNHNPAIWIHESPDQGEARNVSAAILDLLQFPQ